MPQPIIRFRLDADEIRAETDYGHVIEADLVAKDGQGNIIGNSEWDGAVEFQFNCGHGWTVSFCEPDEIFTDESGDVFFVVKDEDSTRWEG